MAAEWDASALRERYGEPVARETFQVRPDLEMVVSYGPARQVCRIELPHTAARKQLDEVIDELVPPSVRDKETGRNLWIVGGYSMSSKIYEHVTISEPLEPDQSASGPGVTITFNRPDCH
ncbi:MAG TPA: hypothetical protein VLM42_06380 [Bryobacteraceae bacterium]|nr:hypothetical protein [Bryobacteraceae bacterium]